MPMVESAKNAPRSLRMPRPKNSASALTHTPAVSKLKPSGHEYVLTSQTQM